MYRVFACMPGDVTVSDSGLCCCVPCLSGALFSFALVMAEVNNVRDIELVMMINLCSSLV